MAIFQLFSHSFPAQIFPITPNYQLNGVVPVICTMYGIGIVASIRLKVAFLLDKALWFILEVIYIKLSNYLANRPFSFKSHSRLDLQIFLGFILASRKAFRSI
ncbi:hypothetical protein AHMF7605_11420 [Adhaeribacter arboris]|uniref:Uncharacterized protein n=1 Tax=Adhaeribacter arboris TaxID=2072846 RepID=A0A2T2YF03_9BACT|nr:hypothetical protein AHMF7605_11420 [Adhaeribacter arboris]